MPPAPAPAPTPEPVPEPEPIPEPEPEADIVASISAVMLGDDCDGIGRPEPDSDSDRAGGGIGDCDGDGCWAPCQQTSMQLLFVANRLPEAAQVEILRVRFRDFGTNEILDELAWREPKHWTESGYAPWDEWLVMLGAEETSWDLTAPNWERIGGGDVWATYSMSFRLEVTLLIGGEEVTLRSGELYRSPDIDT